MQIVKQFTKTLTTKDNGRSSDAVSPNFIYGCLGGCMSSYCYVGRYNHDKVYVNENTNDILHSISQWVEKQPVVKVSNQVSDRYYMIDIGCSTDVPLMQKHYNWQDVFSYFNEHERLRFTFATKYPTKFHPEEYVIEKSNRIRVSLMPQKLSNVLEPSTDKIIERIKAINRLKLHMDTHINLSPIIYTDGWLKLYKELFQMLKNEGVTEIKSECIFLTHNIHQHKRNAEPIKELLWRPEIQESKDSFYAEGNIRYKWQLKNEMKSLFIELYKQFFPVSSIRYIF